MTSTPEEILAVICPAILSVSGYSLYTDMASALTSSGYFGDTYSMAVALMASHLYTVSSRGSTTGMLTMRTEGKLSEQYGGMPSLRSTLDTTNYGMQYKLLRDTRMAAISISDNDILNMIGSFYVTVS